MQNFVEPFGVQPWFGVLLKGYKLIFLQALRSSSAIKGAFLIFFFFCLADMSYNPKVSLFDELEINS